ncbi:MAG: adenylyltransferase/cytidyltransferase family protein [Patescibacteria group bacterium]|nr:adenylyltransferase/cytidyltransferase family protein [Patescibacteria group bacterium]MDE1940827.1 adenylyltransferase/cytidyltransferase family protein [Patescibacteria group bacterium]MDE1966737.1 adenylyltransferase/cytidyltransferase family protein [Patescibacteria group bacterium]
MTIRRLTSNGGIFGIGSNFKDRFVPDYGRLKKLVDHCKGIGLTIVLTQGTYDMVHIGHARYFEEAKKHGDVLVVGVDSDKKVRMRKGPDRPLVPQAERLEMVTHLRPVDIVTVKEHDMPRWHLIRTVRPDVLIVTKETVDKYGKAKMKQMAQFCGKVLILEPMATTSTSAKIRRMQLKLAKKFEKAIIPKIADMISDTLLGRSNVAKK